MRQDAFGSLQSFAQDDRNSGKRHDPEETMHSERSGHRQFNNHEVKPLIDEQVLPIGDQVQLDQVLNDEGCPDEVVSSPK